MPPRLTSTTTRASTPLPSVPAASALPLALTHSSTPSVTQNGKAHLGSSAGKPAVPTRPPSTRPVTPTKHSLQYRSERQLVQANRIRRDTSKAIDAAAQNGGKRKGKGKRSKPAPPNQISIADLDDDEDEDDDDAIEDEDDDEPNQGNSNSVVRTSNPRELIGQITGETYGDELDDPSFCNSLAGKINGVLQDKEKRSQFSRKTLQEALRIVRRSPSVSHGSSWFISSISELPDADSEEVMGREPQSGDKRLSDASQSGPSKRGRAEFSRTPSTVPAVTPPPFGLGRPGGSAPTGRPRTAARPGIAVPKGLPRSKAIHIPDRSPSLLPACFRAAPADTQTMAEDTQTVPEDTQTVPEDTQTAPEDTQTVPVNNQGRPAAGGPRPVAPSSSPDLGAPPSFDRRPRPSPAASLGRSSVPQAAPAIPLSQGSSTRAEELDKMAASLDQNERYRARAFAMRTDRSESQRSAIADLPEEDASEKADARRKAKGLPTKRKPKKAGLNCQAGYPSQAARRAVTDMSAYLFAAGPYIPSGNLLMLALECYERAFQVEFPGIPIEEPYPELILAIAKRAPGARTVAKEHLRSLMTAKGGLGFHADPDTQTKVDENLQLYESIRDNFHFGSLDNPGSHYENPALKTGFVQAFFRDSYAPCAVYHTYFKPAATMQSIGVLLTLTETCIHEWRTGKFKKAHLDSKVQGVMYEKHMRNLRVFARAAPDRFERMCITFYKAGCDNAVPEAMGDSGKDVQPTIRPEDIRPDTPPPATPGAASSGGDV